MTDIEITAASQPLELTVKRFQCVFCGPRFRRATKKLVVEHMKQCWSDPAAKTCRTCVNFERGRATVGYSAYEPPEALDSPDACAIGEPLPERAPVVGCPLWRDRDEQEDEPPLDVWDHGLRGLTADGGEPR